MLNKLRIGVILNSKNVGAWVYRTLEELSKRDDTELKCVLFTENSSPSGVSRSFKTLGTLLVNAYCKYDIKKNPYFPHAFQPMDASHFLSNFLEVKLRDLSTANLDLLVDLSLNQNWLASHQSDLLKEVRLGVWAFQFGERVNGPKAAAYFWEIFQGTLSSEVVLREFSKSQPNSRVLYRSIGAMNLVSLHLTQNPMYWKAPVILSRCLRDLTRLGSEKFYSKIEGAQLERENLQKFNNEPNFWQAVSFIKILLMRKLKTRSRYSRSQWSIAVRSLNQESPNPFSIESKQFSVLRAPKRRFWADPFLLEKNGKTWVFFEDYDWNLKKGRISCGWLNENCQIADVQVILDEPFHLSNPFVFENNGKLILMPEGSRSQKVQLYQCVQFPYQWEKDKTLLNGIGLVDPILLQWNQKWWLFGTLAQYGVRQAWDELYVFYADDLQGEWKAHEQNPVISDASQARPAGRFFVQEGKLFRVAQNCSGGYGLGLSLCEVTELSENRYQQVVRSKIMGKALGFEGVHAYDSSSQFEVIDGKTRSWKFLD